MLRAVDALIARGALREEVFAQIGCATYVPQHFAYERYLDADEFHRHVLESDIVLTHGGTGAIVGALKAGKRVVAVARLSRFGEHVDDHQLQIVRHFENTRCILVARDMDRLDDTLQRAREFQPKVFRSGTENIIGIISGYIDGNEAKRVGK